jgi:hypothetical protein
VASAPRTWILIAAPASLGACVQILGIQPWVPGDAGVGGGGAGGGGGATTTTTSSVSSSSGDAGREDAGGEDAGVCSASQPACEGCEGCADLTGGACAAAYSACTAATGPGGCNNVLTCLGVCGGDSTCIGVCPGQETTATKLFPTYATCLCQQCAPSCASFATALCH